MAFEIIHYIVSVVRDTTAAHVRSIYLEVKPAAMKTDITRATIFFYEHDSNQMGYVDPKKRSLVAFLPYRDYADIYHLLQTEKPVFLSFTTDEQHKLQFFNLGTGKEPVGEAE